MATSVMGVMTMGNIVPRTGIEHTPLALKVNVLTFTYRLPDITNLSTPTSLCGSLPCEVSADYCNTITLEGH